ncbi:hypothetical protein [Hyunsoonleella ulvae]|uniref:hypothetical protein n=1 Tax=Hyunsoonleella ulvae TaxID=2799948 RepID=UPI00193A0D6D|nr:hypothetical protein [Hyunsoonleella ulvae]
MNSLEMLKNKNLLILDFINEFESNPLTERYKGIVIETYELGDIKGMEILANDIIEWSNFLPKNKLDELKIKIKGNDES